MQLCRLRADLAEARLAIAEARHSTAVAASTSTSCTDLQLTRQVRHCDMQTDRGTDADGGCRSTESSSTSAIMSYETPPNSDISRINSGTAAALEDERALAARCVAARAAGAEAAHAALRAVVRDLEYAQVCLITYPCIHTHIHTSMKYAR